VTAGESEGRRRNGAVGLPDSQANNGKILRGKYRQFTDGRAALLKPSQILTMTAAVLLAGLTHHRRRKKLLLYLDP
jgi:hypothetical protein